jgi:Ni/Co efflux regulator RcnB
MKRTVTVFALIALVASTAALADSDGRHRRDTDSRHKYESSREYQRDDRRYRHSHSNDRRDYGHQPRHERRYVHVRKYHPPHGYYHKKWHRGDRLPRGYYARQYVLHDHHVYRLHAPPRGYHWVRVNHDVVLAAIATGVVLDVLYNHLG